MITSYDIFVKMVKEKEGEMPTLKEWLNTGYKRTTYYDAKKRYKENQEIKQIKTDEEVV